MQELEEIERQLRQIREEQQDQRVILDQILAAVTPAPATRLVLTLGVPTAQ
jgi:hypothetical protein